MSFEKGPMQLKNQATCSLVFPSIVQTSEILGILYPGGNCFTVTLSRKGGFRSSDVDPVKALSLFRLNMTSISTFVGKATGSSNRLTDRMAADRLLALTGVVP